jgi:hypothetical protein
MQRVFSATAGSNAPCFFHSELLELLHSFFYSPFPPMHFALPGRG